MKTICGLSALFVVLVSGCAFTRTGPAATRLGSINPGMTKSDVLQILGPPSQAGISPSMLGPQKVIKREVLRYRESGFGQRDASHFVVLLVDGKVDDYGPEVGRLKSELEGVFSDYPKENDEPDAPSDGAKP